MNWQEKMSPLERFRDDSLLVTRSRPGHADLPGAIKYNHKDIRNILERSSARETAVRVAVGSVAKALLYSFNVELCGFVSALGGIKAERPDLSLVDMRGLVAKSEVFTCDAGVEAEMKRVIDAARAAGDTVGGVVEVNATGVPPGLGSHVQWDRRLDARIAMAMMSIQAIKGVEIGLGFETAAHTGSGVHDEIFYDAGRLD